MNYTIIIPVFNTDKTYLKLNLEKLTHINRNDIEIIIVDDGSKKYINKICMEYVNKDTKFKYYYIDNSGVSYARNYGINKSNGKNLIFLDADDYLNIDLINNLSIKNNYDLIIYDYLKKYNIESKNKIRKLEINYGEYCYEKVETLATILVSTYYLNNIHSKIYRKDIIIKNNLYFPVGIKYGEDTIFNLNYFSFCKKINYVENILTYYRIYETSSVRTFNLTRFDDFEKEYLKRCDFLELNIKLNKKEVEKKMYIFLQKLLFDNILNTAMFMKNITSIYKKVDNNNYKNIINYNSKKITNRLEMFLIKNKCTIVLKLLCFLKKMKGRI